MSVRRPSELVHPREVESKLGVSRPTAIKLLRERRIPGAMRVFTDDRGREHWRVDRRAFEAFLAALQGSQT